MKSYLVLIVLNCLLAGSCKKVATNPVVPVEPMPNPTETGANILACKVNGKLHIYKDKMTWSQPDGVSFSKREDQLEKFTYIRGNESDYGDAVSMKIFTWNIIVGKEYKFSVNENKDFADYVLDGFGTENTYFTSDGSGFVKFSRYDSLVAAGTFAFTAYSMGGKKVEVTEGCFDIAIKE